MERDPADLIKLSDVVKNQVVKKTEYIAKIKDIEHKTPDILNLATNTTLNAKINEVKNEIPSNTNLATTSALNANINGIKNKISNINNLHLATTNTTDLTAVENKILNVSNFDKTDYNRKISENENKLLLILIMTNILLYKNLTR